MKLITFVSLLLLFITLSSNYFCFSNALQFEIDKQVNTENYTISNITFDGVSQTLALSGYFGENPNNVTVWIGGSSCYLFSFRSYQIVCFASTTVPAGYNTVYVDIDHYILSQTFVNTQNVSSVYIQPGSRTIYIYAISYNTTIVTNIVVNETGSLIDFYGQFVTNSSAPYILLNGTYYCGITKFTNNNTQCYVSNYVAGYTNVTFELNYYINNFYVYFPAQQPNTSYGFTFYPNSTSLTMTAYGYFGEDYSLVNISVLISYNNSVKCTLYNFSPNELSCYLGSSYPSNGGYYYVDASIGYLFSDRYVVYFEPVSNSTNSSSETSSSSDGPEVTCTLSKQGRLTVEYAGNSSINCTFQGINECYSPGGYQCQGLSYYSYTACLTQHEITCLAGSVTCRVGGLTCSNEGGQLTILEDESINTATFKNNNNMPSPNDDSNTGSSLTMISTLSFFFMAIVILF
ncbi:hypothetical protein DFA_04967 [Cavenderia fasciculata]|uniref:Transmembrane protein n=1 Tax=Cavenderia fasciculata TaxID=261658 RepID=F4PMP0_CACFS|nr:uncharacterized protein DFA_04967 [Cavenderia fasciculata]EGG22837.1 hypothetical protein DFA_04967 [Cavenderia fasciculata]|eukprot:XP_004360688.1 hypothetical protein DFA_04967 [Cavenderia fasciculata]